METEEFMEDVMAKQRLILIIFIVLSLGSLLLVGCGKPAESGEPIPEEEIVQEQSAVQDEVKTAEEPPVAQQEEESTMLPPEPQIVEIPVIDGTLLQGTFYPAEKDASPLVILMHWAPGDQQDWAEIAYWLQNRGLGGSSSPTDKTPWLDASWFPQAVADRSLNVLTFTFRNCEGGCKNFARGDWYLDAQGVVDFAVNLEGIDPTKIVVIGASIGSDGAVDGCAYLNTTSSGTCLGAVSLSPGNYLTIDFAEKVKELNPIPVWCLFAESDPESAPICSSLESPNFQKYSYPASLLFQNGHGMNLIEKSQDPNPLDLILTFLSTVL